MANWASTEYNFRGKGAEKMYDCIKKLELNKAGNPCPSQILEFFGVDTKNMYLRGSIEDVNYDYSDKSITLYMSTAWDDLVDFREWINNELLKEDEGEKVIYSIEESGNNIFRTNDPNHCKYMIDDEEEGEYYYCNYVELIQKLQDKLGTSESDYNKLMDKLDTYNNNEAHECIYVNEFEFYDD